MKNSYTGIQSLRSEERKKILVRIILSKYEIQQK